MVDQYKTPSRQKIIADICREHPNSGNQTLGRALYAKHPLLFTSLNAAECAVRHHRGSRGAYSKQVAEREGRQKPPPALPESKAETWEPYRISARRVLVASDFHLPFQDNAAIEAMFDYAEGYKPDAILINGDLFDFYQASRFDRDPTKPKLLAELDCGKQLFAHMRHRFGDVPIYYRWGNHDRRWDSYLSLQAPLLFEIPEVRNAWHGPAGIREHDITIVPDKRPVMLGGLMVLHCDEKKSGISAPVNPARGAFLRLLCSVLEGHGHQQSEHTERTGDGKIIACWATGCLCGLWPEYAKVNRWSHGFATVDVAKNESYKVELKRIINGVVY